MSNTKNYVHAAISKDNWIKFCNYIHFRMSDAGGAEDIGAGSFFDTTSRTWFMENFIVEAEYEDMESLQHGKLFTIKNSAKLVLSRLKDIAADMIMWSTVDDMVDALDETDSLMKLGEELRTLVCLGVLKDVVSFKILHLQGHRLTSMQQAMLNVFGGEEIMPRISSYLSLNLLIQVGRTLCFERMPSKTSANVATLSFMVRTFCWVLFQELSGTKSLSMSKIKDGVEVQCGSVFRKRGPSDTSDRFTGYKWTGEHEINIEGDEVNTVKEVDDKPDDDDYSSGWKSNSAEAKVVKLFILKNWYNMCKEENSFSPTKLMDIPVREAIAEYNIHATVMGVKEITPEMVQDVKRCAYDNWLNRIVSLGKLDTPNASGPPQPTGDPLTRWQPNTGRVHDVTARREEWSSFYAFHIAAIKSSGNYALSGKRKRQAPAASAAGTVPEVGKSKRNKVESVKVSPLSFIMPPSTASSPAVVKVSPGSANSPPLATNASTSLSHVEVAKPPTKTTDLLKRFITLLEKVPQPDDAVHFVTGQYPLHIQYNSP